MRKKLLVYPQFQLGLLAVNTLTISVAFGCVAFQVRRCLVELKQLGIDAHFSARHAYFRFIDFQSSRMLSLLLVALASAFFISSLITLVLSQRLAGPISRLRGFFASLAEGKEPEGPLQFRKGDFFSDLPHLINRAVGRLRSETKSES